MIHFVDGSQNFSLASPVIAQWTDAQSGHSDKDGGPQQYGPQFTKGDLAVVTAGMPEAEMNTKSPIQHHSLRLPTCDTLAG